MLYSSAMLYSWSCHVIQRIRRNIDKGQLVVGVLLHSLCIQLPFTSVSSTKSLALSSHSFVRRMKCEQQLEAVDVSSRRSLPSLFSKNKKILIAVPNFVLYTNAYSSPCVCVQDFGCCCSERRREEREQVARANKQRRTQQKPTGILRLTL